MTGSAVVASAPATSLRRLWSRAKGAGPAYWILAALVVAGVAMRVVSFTAWWPVSTTLADAIPYSVYAETNPLEDPQHPAGYPALLALIGFVTRDVGVVIVIQHVLGIAAGLALFAAVRRVTHSEWPALAPAAVVLLNADLIFLEHTIMSEGPFLAAIAAAVYACARAIDAPDPWWRWPAATGALIVVAALIRSAALFLLPIAALAIFLVHSRPWTRRWQAPIGAIGVAALLIIGYAFANLVGNGRFEAAPAQGWHLYGRVAPFADCDQISPPDGTARLCESTPPYLRPGGDYYLYLADSPALRAYGRQPWRHHDVDMGAWAREVILHQPKMYALTVWRDVKTFFVPSTRQPRAWAGGDLDAELDWTAWHEGSAKSVRNIEARLAVFFDPVKPSRNAGSLEFLHDYQRVFRFGATLLTLATLLTVLGLLIGTRRSRIGVLLFGVGGLAMLVGPTLSVYAIGRYTVPVAPLIAGGAAISVWTLWRMERTRRASLRRPASSA